LPAINPAHPLGDKSRYRIDYEKKRLEDGVVKSYARKSQDSVPFSGNSKYRADYVDWGIPTVPPVEYVNTKPKVPFEGKSIYGDSYVPIDLKHRPQSLKKR